MGLIEIIVQKFVVVDREMAYFCEFLYAQKAPIPRRTSSFTRSVGGKGELLSAQTESRRGLHPMGGFLFI